MSITSIDKTIAVNGHGHGSEHPNVVSDNRLHTFLEELLNFEGLDFIVKVNRMNGIDDWKVARLSTIGHIASTKAKCCKSANQHDI